MELNPITHSFLEESILPLAFGVCAHSLQNLHRVVLTAGLEGRLFILLELAARVCPAPGQVSCNLCYHAVSEHEIILLSS